VTAAVLQLCAFLLVAWALARFVDWSYRRADGDGGRPAPATAAP
jgi:hypothetical protein